MKKIKLLVFSAVPFFIGFLLNAAITKLDWYKAPVFIASLIFSLYWLWLGYKSYDYAKTAKESLVVGHGFAIASLIALFIQSFASEFFLKHSLECVLFNLTVVLAPQMYFLPVLGVVSWVQRALFFFVSTHHILGTYLLSFLFMLAVYYLGYTLRLKRK